MLICRIALLNVPDTAENMPRRQVAYSLLASAKLTLAVGVQHILVNTPADQTSRWSGHQTASSKQWIILELGELSLVRSITFGKFHKGKGVIYERR